MARKISYSEITAADVPQGIVWVTPRAGQGQIVETSYAVTPAAGRRNYEAGYGDPWTRVIDRSMPADSSTTFYRRG